LCDRSNFPLKEAVEAVAIEETEAMEEEQVDMNKSSSQEAVVVKKDKHADKRTLAKRAQYCRSILKWKEKQRKLEERLIGKERLTLKANQYRLLVPTNLAEKLLKDGKLQSIIDQVKEEDSDADIIVDVSQEAAVDDNLESMEVEEKKESNELKRAADSVLVIQAETQAGLEKALLLLAPELHITDSNPPRAGFELRLMVPSHCTIHIIGEAGKTITEIRKDPTLFVQVYRDMLPFSQENVVRVQHREYEGLVKTVTKLFDLYAETKTSADIVQYKPFWFKECAYDNTGSYTDTFHYERTVTRSSRNTPFYEDIIQRERQKRKLKMAEEAAMSPPPTVRYRRGPGARVPPLMRGGAGPNMGMYGGYGPPRAGRMRSLRGQRGFPMRGRGAPAPMTYDPSYEYSVYDYHEDTYTNSAYGYHEEPYTSEWESHIGEYSDEGYEEDSFAAGIAFGIALARKENTIGMNGRARRPRGMGLGSRGGRGAGGMGGASNGIGTSMRGIRSGMRGARAGVRGMGYNGGYHWGN